MKILTVLIVLMLLFSCSKESPTEEVPEYREISQLCVVNKHGALVLTIRKSDTYSTDVLCANLIHQIADKIELKIDRTKVRYILEDRTIVLEYEFKETDQFAYKL